jgi:hypothetical protein
MPPKVFKPKKKRDRGAEALERLRNRWKIENEEGDWDGESEPVITPMLKAVGIGTVIDALRMHDDEDARAFLEAYDGCTETDARLLRIEDIAFAAGVGSLRLAEIAQTALFLYGQMQTNMLMAAHLPAVVEKSLKLAKTNKGIFDREMMLKAGKILPIAKGAQIAFVNNNNADQPDRAPAAPLWKTPEDRLREIHDMTEPKRLPSPAAPPITIGGHIDNMQAETVEILRGE